MNEKEDRILNNFKTYSRYPVNKFKHSNLDIFMKNMKTPYQQDSSKSKDDNSKEILRNRRNQREHQKRQRNYYNT